MTEKKTGIRLSRLTIKNYKKLDSLEIEFPPLLMEGDADILLFGSKNGGGKTSVLEFGDRLRVFRESELLLDIANLLVKAGKKEAVVKQQFSI